MNRLHQLRKQFLEDFHEVENLPGTDPKYLQVVKKNRERINEMNTILGIKV